VAIGFLYAPKSGKETRAMLREKAGEVKEKTSEVTEKAKEVAIEAMRRTVSEPRKDGKVSPRERRLPHDQ